MCIRDRPCFYGIDFPSPAELIANAVQDEEEMLEAVRHAINADTLGYLSLRSLIAATEQPASRLCMACFDGKYPIELPKETALGKNVIEHMLANAARGSELGELGGDRKRDEVGRSGSPLSDPAEEVPVGADENRSWR